jgi:hypothetical protein
MAMILYYQKGKREFGTILNMIDSFPPAKNSTKIIDVTGNTAILQKFQADGHKCLPVLVFTANGQSKIYSGKDAVGFVREHIKRWDAHLRQNQAQNHHRGPPQQPRGGGGQQQPQPQQPQQKQQGQQQQGPVELGTVCGEDGICKSSLGSTMSSLSGDPDNGRTNSIDAQYLAASPQMASTNMAQLKQINQIQEPPMHQDSRIQQHQQQPQQHQQNQQPPQYQNQQPPPQNQYQNQQQYQNQNQQQPQQPRQQNTYQDFQQNTNQNGTGMLKKSRSVVGNIDTTAGMQPPPPQQARDQSNTNQSLENMMNNRDAM